MWEKDKIYNLADSEEYRLYLERFEYFAKICQDNFKS